MRCALVLSVCFAAFAQNTTTVTGTLADAFGNGSLAKLAATCGFRSGATFSTSNGWTVLGGVSHNASVSNGALSVALVPTPSGQYVEMRCHVPLQTADGRSCEGNSSLISQGLCLVGASDIGPLYLFVPSTGPALLNDIKVDKPPAPSLLVRVSQLDTRALAAGKYCIDVSSAGVASLTTVGCPGSGTGGSTALSWSGLTSGQWAGLTSGQWTALGN